MLIVAVNCAYSVNKIYIIQSIYLYIKSGTNGKCVLLSEYININDILNNN